jgi:hypothetical protein
MRLQIGDGLASPGTSLMRHVETGNGLPAMRYEALSRGGLGRVERKWIISIVQRGIGL